jgi:hypothetical protein
MLKSGQITPYEFEIMGQIDGSTKEDAPLVSLNATGNFQGYLDTNFTFSKFYP